MVSPGERSTSITTSMARAVSGTSSRMITSIDQYGHQMSLTLSDTNEQPEPEYTPPRSKEKEKSQASAPSGNAAQVVAEAQSWVGKLRYVFGGKSIVNGTGDCSGFTKYVYQKAAGINIGDGTSNQLTKGQKIRFRGRSSRRHRLLRWHVPGRRLARRGRHEERHDGQPSSYGCKEERYDAGYWKKYLLEVRRVL